jgi:hypothetical protein
MNINEMTIGQARELSSLFSTETTQALGAHKETPFEIGESYLIRTVTMAWHGEVKKIAGDFLILCDAAWIADTGRFHDALKDANNFHEVEPAVNDVIVSCGSIIDATKLAKIKHSQK